MNDDPVANDDSATVAEDSGANPIDVLANDNDGPDTGETLTVTVVSNPPNGTATITGGGTGVSYTPDANYFGSDSFTYTISDGNGGTDTATVSITVTNVNDDPVANDDSATVAEDSGANPIDVLANDNDGPDTGETLTVTVVSNPPNGTATITGGGTGVSYTPDANYFGSDSFTYTISDGNGGTDTATVSITVSAVNDKPTVSSSPATSAASPVQAIYSDQIPVVDVTASDIDSAGTSLQIASLSWKKSTDPAYAATTPLGGLSLVLASTGASSRTWTLQGRALVPEGVYIVRIAVSDGSAANGTSDYLYVYINVSKETMSLEYTGQSFVSTPKVGGTATVQMSALVTEQQDGLLGTKTWSTIPLQVKFTIWDMNHTSIKGTCTANVTQTAAQMTAGQGIAGCSLTGLGANQYIIEMELVLNGYYTAPVEDVALTVTDPGTGFTTGGGWINDPNTNAKSNFGFTVKYLKNGNIQGNSLFIYRMRTDLGGLGIGAPSGLRDYNFIVKSNAMDALVQKCTNTPSIGDPPCWATFTGRSNLKAVDRSTGIAYSFGSGTIGNQQSFQVDVTDAAEPGSSPGTGPDKYAIRIWTSNGTYYQVGTSSTDIDHPGTQIPITGGNIQVRLKP